MHQSQFDQIYRELKESDPTNPKSSVTEKESDVFNGVLIALEDGTKMIFYYAFLVSVKLFLHADCNELIMRFTSEIVKLKGYLLNPLFLQFTGRKPSFIQIVDGRYVISNIVSHSIVIEAIIEDRN